ncbi:N utilization substance protein A [Rickettsiales bacterium Ac37b]|nr:N utilization substance protein A [Rickettsiales bacterium Ac37b]
MSVLSIGGNEILQIIDAVAREKGISRESVFEAMEQSIQVAGRKKYGHEHNIQAEIDRKTGEIKLYRKLSIVKDVEDYAKEISYKDAKELDSAAEVGGEILDLLPPIDLGRVAAQTAKQVIVQKVRDAEREREYQDFKDRMGEIINGVVKRVEYGNVTIDLGRAEAILKRESMLPHETFRQGDRIRAYILSVTRENKGPQIILSRTCNEFLAKLFAQEVPEVYDNIIEIKAVAREPGSRAKVAVYSADSTIDAVGSCVGVRGARVQAVISELQNEKIDIIQWSAKPATFVVNALAPAEISKVVIDENKRRIEVVVSSDQLSLAIGRRGQNVKLASQLTGWGIDVLTEDEESKRRSEEFNTASILFMKALNVEEVLAQLLVAEGFYNIEEIAYTELEELQNIEGFDAVLATELKNRAQNYLEQQNNSVIEEVKSLGADIKLEKLLNIPIKLLLVLAKQGIKNVQDIADLSRQEFKEIVGTDDLSAEEIDEIIMQARHKVNL